MPNARSLVPIVLIVGVLCVVPGSRAHAQTDTRVAVGADVSKRVFASDNFHRGIRPSFLYRIRMHRSTRNGWRFQVPQFGFNWGGADRTEFIGGEEIPFGHLHIIGVGAGVAETLVMNEGADELSFSLLAGPGFTHFSLDDAARDAYRRRLGLDPLHVDVKNTVIVRPGVSFWHDLGPRLGFHASISYIFARPTAVIRTSAGETKTRWTADDVAFKAGLAIGIF
jgi:hypothetical protein